MQGAAVPGRPGGVTDGAARLGFAWQGSGLWPALLCALALVCAASPTRAEGERAAAAGLVERGAAVQEKADAAELGARGGHGLALLGRLKYPAEFPHFDYVHPAAPKGGRVRVPGFGTFDSLNGFILKGRPAAGVRYLSSQNYIYDSLAVASADEPGSRYGLLARTLERTEGGRGLRVELRPEARWHDGRPLTADDVVFTFRILKAKATPVLRVALAGLESVERRGPHEVEFRLARPRDRATLETLLGLPILPRHYWEERDFEKTTLDPPLGSGPYRVSAVDPGRSIHFARVEDYWAKDLPVNVGQHNFDEIEVEYFLDTDVRLEALKGGAIDYVLETVSKTWARGYDFPARDRGDFELEVVRLTSPATVRALLFNTRLPKLADRRVRKALVYAFDREWKNRVQTHELYELGNSYFPSSELAHEGAPTDAELELLAPFREQLPKELFEGPFENPASSGFGPNRDNLRVALQLLSDAGYEIRDERLVDRETGEPFTLELLLDSSARTRMSLLFAQALERLGIETRMRVVETAQLVNKRRSLDFEMLYGYYVMRSLPGRELASYFSSQSAENQNSRNYAGISDPVVDHLIERALRAPDYDSLVTAARALDRVLLFGYYMIDLGYAPGARIAYWDRFGKPQGQKLFQVGFPELWWFDEAKDARIRSSSGGPRP